MTLCLAALWRLGGLSGLHLGRPTVLTWPGHRHTRDVNAHASPQGRLSWGKSSLWGPDPAGVPEAGCGMGCGLCGGSAQPGVNLSGCFLTWFERNGSGRQALQLARRSSWPVHIIWKLCPVAGWGLGCGRGWVPLLWRPPKGPQTPLRAGKAGQEKEKNGIWAEGGGQGLSFCSEEPFGFSQQIRKSGRRGGGGAVLTPVTPSSKSGETDTHMFLVLN